MRKGLATVARKVARRYPREVESTESIPARSVTTDRRGRARAVTLLHIPGNRVEFLLVRQARRAHWTGTDHRRYFFESAVTTSRPLGASEPQVTDDVERKIHLNPEQTRLAMSIEQIDEELTENEAGSEQVAIAGIRSGGSVPASGGVLRGRDSLDHQHEELLARRADLAAKLKQSVGEHPDTD